MNERGEEIKADAFGNNVAFCCLSCGHPVLATAFKNQRGMDEEHPAACKRCGNQYVLDVQQDAGKLYIRSLH